MPRNVIPIAKSLYLCDGHLGFENQKADLMGVFNVMRAKQYPHIQARFVVFAQLTATAGKLPSHLEVTFAATGEPIFTTTTRILTFPRRDKIIQLAWTIENCRFPQPGRHLVELFCDGQWVADTNFELL